MNHDQYAGAIRSEGHALASSARMAGPDAPVLSCPEWTVSDLLAHIGRVHRWVTRAVIDRTAELRGEHWVEAGLPPDTDALAWFASGVDPLADALLEAGPDVAVWSWAGDKTSGFWARRQAHETAVHRYDAQLAAGATEPVERVLAVDGIDEFFDLIPFSPWADRVRGNGETLHLHCTDGEGEWLARLDRDAFRVTREHAKGDVAARGTASDLLLWLWGRVDPEHLDVFGDASVLARWRGLVSW